MDPEHRARVSPSEAAEILAERDPVIADLLGQTGPPRLPRPKGQPFEALARAIVYQQLAGAAAGAIYGRLIAAAGGEIEPERIAGLSDEQLRAVGLSRAKVLSLRDLAAKSLDGTISLSGRALARKSDAEVEEQLRSVRGIGPWTAQVFMMFRLRRLDIWPTADLAIRRGYGLAWGVPTPTARQLEPLGDPYRPYRTILSLYCWRASELYGRGGADFA
jgi:DNA-3-methyladenine glycosylase II